MVSYMKKALLVYVAAAVGLFFGYSLGYRQGTREEKQAWLSTAEVGPDKADGPLFCYRNPHVGIAVWRSRGLPPVNRPDPRALQQYEHLSP